MGRDNGLSSLQSAAQSLARTTAASAVNAKGQTSSYADPRGIASLSNSLAASYRLEVAKRILELCSRNTYENVTDFNWYLSVLVDLAYVSNVGGIGASIREQLVDVVIRVKSPESRKFATELMIKLLSDDALLENCNDETSCSEVLRSAAWICGEYCE